MATPNSRIPHIIEPYTRQAPDQALTLITGVLDATPYWLVTQFIAAALACKDADGGRTAVVLVSWMRDLEYWRSDIKKSTVWPLTCTNPSRRLISAGLRAEQAT